MSNCNNCQCCVQCNKNQQSIVPNLNLQLDGKLCFYFPFKLKDMGIFRTFRKRWKTLEKRHRNIVKYGHFPSTELMDREAFVEDKERILSYVQRRISGAIILDSCSPYATPCIQNDYRYSLSDNVSTKEISAVISRFSLIFNTNNGPKEVCGALIFNVNLDNLVATSIVSINFDKLSVDEIILLKHCFYKRSLVYIKEYKPSILTCHQCDNDTCLLVNDANASSVDLGMQTIHQYVCNKTPWLNFAQSPMDCKTRHCLMEILISDSNRTQLTDSQLCGLCSSDEGWEYARIKKWHDKNKSTRMSYDFYLDSSNALVLTRVSDYNTYIQHQNDFLTTLKHNYEHIRPLLNNKSSCIPAIGKRYYPAFVKSVEIAYLINEVNTNDISPKVKSYINPFIIIRRCYKLWKIIHEVDMNVYHTSNDINSSFGNKSAFAKLREEYAELLSHGINYLLAVVAILTLLVTAMSIWK